MAKKIEAVAELPEPQPEAEVRELPFREGVVTIPSKAGKWPTKALMFLDDPGNVTNRDVMSAMELVLGPEQWALVTDSLGEEFDVTASAFTDAVLEIVYGKKPGK